MGERAESITGPPDFVAAFARVSLAQPSGPRAGGDCLEAARADEDIATVAAQLMSQREVMASWLVNDIVHRSALREGTDRAAAVDTVWTLMDPVVFCRLTGDRHWTTARFERWFTDSVTRLVLSADNTR